MRLFPISSRTYAQNAKQVLLKLIKLAKKDSSIETLWLYGSQEKDLSVIDIKQTPIPLAFSVIQAGKTLLSKNTGMRNALVHGVLVARIT